MIHSIQYLRFLGAFAVLLFHLFALNERYYSGINLPDFFSIGNFGVDIFFIISGYVMALITYNAIPGLKTVRQFLIKRAYRIYPIYWFYTFIVFVIYFYYPNMVNSSYVNSPSVLRSLLLLPDNTTPWLNVGWTLVYEVYFYFIVSILLFFKIQVRNYFLASYFVFIIFYNYNFYLNSNPINPFEQYYLSPLICEFIMGYWLFFQKFKIPKIFGIFLSFFSILIVIYLAINFDINSNFKRLLIYGLPSLLLVYSINLIFTGLKKSRFISILGDISYSTYLSHILVLNSIGVIFNFLEFDSLYGSIICIIISVFAVYIWSYLSYNFIEKKISLQK